MFMLVSAITVGIIFVGFSSIVLAARKTTPFGIRVPPEHLGDQVVVVAFTTYWAFLLASLMIALGLIPSSAPWWVPPVLATVGGIVGLAVSRGLILRQKRQGLWNSEYVNTVWGSTQPAPAVPLPAIRYVVAYAMSVAVIVVGMGVWDSIPSRLPMHWGASGVVDQWATKGIGTAFIGAWVGLGLTSLLLVFAIVSRKRAFRGVSSDENGMQTQEALEQWASQGIFASCAVILAIAASLIAFMSWAPELPTYVVPLVSISMLVCLVVVLIGYTLARRQAMFSAEAWSSGAANDDENWIGGLLYVNTSDYAVVVPKRIGIGWTVNLGRLPVAMLVIIATAFPMVAVVVVTVTSMT